MMCSPDPPAALASTSLAVRGAPAAHSAALRASSAACEPAVSAERCSAALAAMGTRRKRAPPSAAGAGRPS
eukprot:7863723-Alexandrium_andersonii.AAC.1